MGRFVDLSGFKFERWTVIKRVGTRGNDPLWLCRCECGNENLVVSQKLKNGTSKSCGCLARELSAGRAGAINKKHGLSNTRIYRIYTAMKQRCYNPNRWNYEKYGGRGISICAEWLNDFKTFYDWAIGNGYSDHLSIDRIDNDKGYSPDNCRWSDNSLQGYNRRLQANNATGYKGVSITCNDKYRAYLKKNNKQINLGVFHTFAGAVYARKVAEKKYYRSDTG